MFGFRVAGFRVGISETVSLIIGVAIAITIGVILFNLMPSLISSQLQTARASATALAIRESSNSVRVILQVKYLGSVSAQLNVTGITIYLRDGSTLPFKVSEESNVTTVTVSPSQPIPLNPGDEIAVTITIKDDRIGSVMPGDRVVVEYALLIGDKRAYISTASTTISF